MTRADASQSNTRLARKLFKQIMASRQGQQISVDLEQLAKETQGRYRYIKVLGRGSYGIVVLAESCTGELVALKRVERTFESVLDAKRILREIKILSKLRHENITNLLDVCCVADFTEFTALIVVIDLMETDMSTVIRVNPDLGPDHRRYFIYQVLRGLKYIHSANVIHRDLKPSNLLLNSDCDLKICDFGLARVAENEDPNEFLSEYVATRWYRAPEVLLNYEKYDSAIDMWSVGCIFAELVLQRPIFMGENVLHQLTLITELLGTPTLDDLRDCTNEKARAFMASLPIREKIPLAQVMPNALPEEIDMMERLLTWDPTKRMTAEQALEHPFMEKFHDPFDEPCALPIEDFEFEGKDVTMADMKVLMWNEVIKFHPEFVQQ